jgi:hypothetical protein
VTAPTGDPVLTLPALALAEGRIVELERENEMLRGALRSVVEHFTAPIDPDGPPPGWGPQ